MKTQTYIHRKISSAADECQPPAGGVLKSPASKQALSGMVVVAVAILPLLVEMRGAALTLRHVGDWLGWFGAGMLSSSLLLMVREPLIVGWFGGLERMYRWHHAFGVWACVVLLAHPLVLAVAVLPTSATRAWNLLSPARWFPSNALGWAALFGLTVGLVVALSRRIRYATWRRLHFCLSLAVLLGIAHAFAYRGLDTSLVLIAAPSVLALGWRVLRADRGVGARPYEVESVAQVASKTTEIVLRPLAGPLTVAPGQFVMAAFFEGPHYRGCGEFHPYTVCDSRDDSLVLAVKALGDCTTRIQTLERGVAARVQGPYGQFLVDTSQSPSLWIAGGIGVTPFIAKLRAGDLTTPTELIYTYRRPDAAPYLAELQEHADHQPLLGLRTLVVQEDPRPVFALFDDVQDLNSREVYMCGPPLLVHAVVEELHRRGVARSNMHFEDFEFRSSRS
jgi:predicted ferric reductase